MTNFTNPMNTRQRFTGTTVSKKPTASSASGSGRSPGYSPVLSGTTLKPNSSPSNTSLAYDVKQLDGQGQSPDKIIEMLNVFAAVRNVSIGDLIIDVIKTGVLSSSKLIEIFASLLDATSKAGLDNAKCITGQEKGEKAFQLAMKSEMNDKLHDIAKKNADSLDKQADTDVATGSVALGLATASAVTANAEAAVADVAAVAELGLNPLADEQAIQLNVAAAAADVILATEATRFAITVAEAMIKHTQAAKLRAEANDPNSNLDDMSAILKVASDGIYGGCADPAGARMAANMAFGAIEAAAGAVALFAGEGLNPALIGFMANDVPSLVGQGLVLNQRNEYLAAHGGDVDAAENAMSQDKVGRDFIAGLAGGIAGLIMLGVNLELVSQGYNAFGDDDKLKEVPTWAQVILVIANIIIAIAAAMAISAIAKKVGGLLPNLKIKSSAKLPKENEIEMTKLKSDEPETASPKQASGEENAEPTEMQKNEGEEVLEAGAEVLEDIEMASTSSNKGTKASDEETVSQEDSSKVKKSAAKKEANELEEVPADEAGDVEEVEKSSVKKTGAASESEKTAKAKNTDKISDEKLEAVAVEEESVEAVSSVAAKKLNGDTSPVKGQNAEAKAGKTTDQTKALAGAESVKNTKQSDSTNASKKSLDKKVGSSKLPGENVRNFQMATQVVLGVGNSANRYIQSKNAADTAYINVDIQEKQVAVSLHESLLEAEKQGGQLNQTMTSDAISMYQKLTQKVQETATQGLSDDISALEDAVSQLQGALL